MRNGRCRLHGGKSTGPRTADGLERSRRARWVHGARSREFAAMRAEGVRIRRRIRALCDMLAARVVLDSTVSPVDIGSIVAKRGIGGCSSRGCRQTTEHRALIAHTSSRAAPAFTLDGHDFPRHIIFRSEAAPGEGDQG
jgi:hypothetical protein